MENYKIIFYLDPGGGNAVVGDAGVDLREVEAALWNGATCEESAESCDGRGPTRVPVENLCQLSQKTHGFYSAAGYIQLTACVLGASRTAAGPTTMRVDSVPPGSTHAPAWSPGQPQKRVDRILKFQEEWPGVKRRTSRMRANPRQSPGRRLPRLRAGVCDGAIEGSWRPGGTSLRRNERETDVGVLETG